MLKKIFVTVSFFLVLLLLVPAFYLVDHSQSVTPRETGVVYNLPYPGILPDHPLYFTKIIRDRILEWTTRDNFKKAQLYLLFSDKRAAMSLQLEKKGKYQQAISTFSKGEKYFLSIPQLIIDLRKQGSSVPSEFIQKLKLSNAKHQNLIDVIENDLPQGQTNSLDEIKKINNEIKISLEKL